MRRKACRRGTRFGVALCVLGGGGGGGGGEYIYFCFEDENVE